MARLPKGYRTLTRAELRQRGLSPKSEQVIGPQGQILPRRQAENVRAKLSGWKSWSEFQSESSKRNPATGRVDFLRWAHAAADENDLSFTDVNKPDSEFSQLYVEAKRSDWSHKVGGPMDQMLRYIGYRKPDWNFDVGDTPFAGK